MSDAVTVVCAAMSKRSSSVKMSDAVTVVCAARSRRSSSVKMRRIRSSSVDDWSMRSSSVEMRSLRSSRKGMSADGKYRRKQKNGVNKFKDSKPKRQRSVDKVSYSKLLEGKK